jgi:hypothetical protein
LDSDRAGDLLACAALLALPIAAVQAGAESRYERSAGRNFPLNKRRSPEDRLDDILIHGDLQLHRSKIVNRQDGAC